MKLSDLNEKDIELVSHPDQSEPSKNSGILDKLKELGSTSVEKAGDFTTAAGRSAVSAALPLTGINTEKLAGAAGTLGSAILPESMGGEKLEGLSLDQIKDFGKRLGVSYDEAKKFAENYKKQQEERSPIATTAGELGGSLIGGGALLKGIGKVVPALEGLGEGKIVGKALGIGEEGGGISGALGRTGAKVVEGAPLGAAYGVDTAQPGDKLKGALTGAAMGSGIGLAAGLGYEGGKAIKGLYDASKTVGQGYQPIRQLQLARQVAREGITTPTGENITSIYGKGGEQINQAADDLSKQATEKLYGAREGLQDQYGKVLTDLDKQGITLKPDAEDLTSISEAANIADELPALYGSKGEVAQTQDLLNKFAQGTLTPSEGKQLQLSLRKAKTNASSRNLGTEQSKIEATLDNVTSRLSDLPIPQNGGPSYQDINDMYREYSGTMGSLVNKGEIDPKYADTWVSDLGNRSDIKNIMSELIDYVQKPGVSGDDKKLLLNKVEENFNNLEKSKPGFLKSQGIDFNNIKSDINEMSDLVNVSKSARGQQPFGSDIGNIIGKATPSAATAFGKVEKVVPEFTQKLFNMPGETLRSITPDLPEHISSALNNAINTNDQAKKNAVLFSIVQNPDLRMRINKRLGISENP